MVPAREVPDHSSVVDLHSTLSPHITQVIAKGYDAVPIEPISPSYVPEEAEEIEIFDGPWDPELRRSLLTHIQPVGEDCYEPPRIRTVLAFYWYPLSNGCTDATSVHLLVLCLPLMTPKILTVPPCWSA